MLQALTSYIHMTWIDNRLFNLLHDEAEIVDINVRLLNDKVCCQ